MKNLLKVSASLLALGLAAATLQAQPPAGAPGGGGGGRGGRGGRGGVVTIEQVEAAAGTLTADQKTKITAAIEKATKDREAAMAAQDFTKLQEINAAQRTAIKAALTEEQNKKFDEAMPARGGGGGGRGQGGPGGPGGGGGGGRGPGGPGGGAPAPGAGK